MSALHSHAIRWEWTDKNPITQVRQSAKRSKIPTVLSVEEIQRLFSCIKEPCRTAVILDAVSGLRVGELLGLKWEDVRFDQLELNVTRSVSRQVVTPCKTEVSRKPVPMRMRGQTELTPGNAVTLPSVPAFSPAAGVKLPKVDNGRLRYLTPGELKNALRAAPEWMRAPLALAALTGCRRGELLSLRWDDVNIERKVVFVAETKNGEPKAVPLNLLAIEVLECLPQTDDLVLPGVDGPRLSVETKRLFKRLGIKDASFHTLRHTAASWAVMQGADLYSVGQLLGHKTLKMTKRYAHLSPGYMQNVAGKLDVAFKGVLPETVAGD